MQYATTHGVVDRRAAQSAGFIGWAAEIVQRLRTRLDERERYLQTRDELMALSDRELQVLRLLAEGHTTDGLADALFISPRTATTHLTHIMGKLGVPTRTAAVALALRESII